MAKLKLENVRLSFPALDKPEDYKGDGKFNFKATFLIDKKGQKGVTDKVMAEIKRVATEKWGAKADAYLEDILQDKKGCCYINGDRYEYDGYAGMMALAARKRVADGRVVVVDRDKSPIFQPDGTPYPGKEGRVYGGCYVNAVVEIWAQQNDNGRGIRCSLLSVQYAKEGDAFSGGAKGSADDFDELSVEDDEDSLV